MVKLQPSGYAAFLLCSSCKVKKTQPETLSWQTREIQASKFIKAVTVWLLMKVLSSCNAPKSLSSKEMEALTAHSSEEDLKKRHLSMTCDNEDEPCQLIDRHRKRKNVISLPFTFRRSSHESESQGHIESVLKSPLFGLPLSLVYGAEDTLPKSIQDILTILFQKGPFSEGIFRKAANEKARKELREELNAGDNVALGKKSVYLLAVVFKDFLRSIPHKLLLTELYDEWMTALEKINHHEKTEAMKEVASKLPQPNLHLLKHLLSLLQHISKNSKVNKMDSSNLAICFGPTMLSPNWDKSLPLEIQKELADKSPELEPEPAKIKKQHEAHKKMLERKQEKKENEVHAPEMKDVGDRSDVQTELYLEEILDRIIEVDMECQTDAFIKRLPSPVFIPQKTGVDVATQIEEGELFDFDIEVKPMLEVLVGKTVEQALLEVMEEEDLRNLWAHQYAYLELHNAELAEVQRLEENERRHREEKERRMAMQYEIQTKAKVVAKKVAAHAFSIRYLADLIPSVFISLRNKGFFYDEIQSDIEKGFLPFVMGHVELRLQKKLLGRIMTDCLINEVIKKRLDNYEHGKDTVK
ncbi:uncharacterized protein LOC113417088, partial [Notechis scutatus]|uniref:Uncharacterized protein LOC113417088 n=1 Tax=Notechis scutatus TaxID=8663 RepID=A0A6J1UJN1_9SAUR